MGSDTRGRFGFGIDQQGHNQSDGVGHSEAALAFDLPRCALAECRELEVPSPSRDVVLEYVRNRVDSYWSGRQGQPRVDLVANLLFGRTPPGAVQVSVNAGCVGSAALVSAPASARYVTVSTPQASGPCRTR